MKRSNFNLDSGQTLRLVELQKCLAESLSEDIVSVLQLQIAQNYSPNQSCGGVCLDLCSGRCTGSCTGSCLGTCKGICSNSCSSGCGGNCTGTSKTIIGSPNQ